MSDSDWATRLSSSTRCLPMRVVQFGLRLKSVPARARPHVPSRQGEYLSPPLNPTWTCCGNSASVFHIASSPCGAAFEELPVTEVYDLVFSAAALHWTNPVERWSRVAGLLKPGGVFASFGGQTRLVDPSVEDAVRAVRAPFLEEDDVPSPDGTPPESEMQWPGTELQRSDWFSDVHQHSFQRRPKFSAHEYIGYLSTVSAYLQLPPSQQEQVFARILRVLPEEVAVVADINLHLARRQEHQTD